MIILNDDNFIETEADLNLFVDFLQQETYDDNSEKVANMICDYLVDVFERMQRVNASIKSKVSPNLKAYAFVEFEPTTNFMQTNVQVFSTDENYEAKKRDEIVLDGIIKLHLNGLKSLWDRMMLLDFD